MVDSVDKIVTTYFSAVSTQPFVYKGVAYMPKPIEVSTGIFYDYTCPEGCGACCSRFSLDYLPNEIEPHPYPLEQRGIRFDTREVRVWSDTQSDGGHFCLNLDQSNGRCGIHGKHPFSCDFELLRFFHHKVSDSHGPFSILRQALYGRGHAMLRIDGARGAQCSIVSATDSAIPETLRKLKRLMAWTDHFGLDTLLPDIIKWVEEGPYYGPLCLANADGPSELTGEQQAALQYTPKRTKRGGGIDWELVDFGEESK